MKSMIKLSLALASYAVVACVGLALVYQATKPMIEAAAAKEVALALGQIFPDAQDFEDVSEKVVSDNAFIKFEKAYLAKSNGIPSGIVIQATGPTYASATILVGVTPDKIVKGVTFMALSDTPGLGTKTKAPSFINQFIGKPTSSNLTIGGDVTAISGATISSKGVANIIDLAVKKADAFLTQQ